MTDGYFPLLRNSSERGRACREDTESMRNEMRVVYFLKDVYQSTDVRTKVALPRSRGLFILTRVQARSNTNKTSIILRNRSFEKRKYGNSQQSQKNKRNFRLHDETRGYEDDALACCKSTRNICQRYSRIAALFLCQVFALILVSKALVLYRWLAYAITQRQRRLPSCTTYSFFRDL